MCTLPAAWAASGCHPQGSPPSGLLHTSLAASTGTPSTSRQSAMMPWAPDSAASSSRLAVPCACSQCQSHALLAASWRLQPSRRHARHAGARQARAPAHLLAPACKRALQSRILVRHHRVRRGPHACSYIRRGQASRGDGRSASRRNLLLVVRRCCCCRGRAAAVAHCSCSAHERVACQPIALTHCAPRSVQVGETARIPVQRTPARHQVSLPSSYQGALQLYQGAWGAPGAGHAARRAAHPARRPRALLANC